MRFELQIWGDEVVLVHWDSIHGDDIVITLNDGNAYVEREKINLVEYLIKLSRGRCDCRICMPENKDGSMR